MTDHPTPSNRSHASNAAINPVSQLSAIVLAGGQSSRMGTDKALVEIEGQPMLLRVCEVAFSCTPWVYVVSGWNHRYQPILDDRVKFVQEVSLVKDIYPHGPLVGFAQGLQQVKTDWVLLLACDMPCLSPEELYRWMQELPHLSLDTRVALARNRKGWWEPMCGFYRRDCQSSLDAFIQSGGRSFQRWLESQKVYELRAHDPEMLFNCNTPADVERVESRKGAGED
jgi:molybdopterin-guanine dinucleotide biosynthesis protein A